MQFQSARNPPAALGRNQNLACGRLCVDIYHLTKYLSLVWAVPGVLKTARSRPDTEGLVGLSSDLQWKRQNRHSVFKKFDRVRDYGFAED